ncbi:MAG: ferredoxin [Candidatus Micrarchaeia archaeon]|jgi:ferredoxin
MSKYKIEFDRELCIGCQSCNRISRNWGLDSEGKAKPANLDVEEADLQHNMEAEKYCPVHAIKVVKKQD